MQIFPSPFLVSFISTPNISTQLLTQFYPDLLHPNFISHILTLISCILHILPLIPHIPILYVALFLVSIPSFRYLIPHSGFYHFLLLTQNKLLISKNLNYWIDRKCEYCKTVICIARNIKQQLKKYLFIKTMSCCSKHLNISEIPVLNSAHY